MVCHGQHTYVYSQVLLAVLAQEPRGGATVKRLAQEVMKCAQQRWVRVIPFTNPSSLISTVCEVWGTVIRKQESRNIDSKTIWNPCNKLIGLILGSVIFSSPFEKRCFRSNLAFSVGSSHDVTPITMALNGAAAYPQACQALTSMLSRNALNPADISVLYRNYSALDPPPIDLIRTPQFLGK